MVDMLQHGGLLQVILFAVLSSQTYLTTAEYYTRTHTHTNPLHTFIHSCIISCSIYYPLNPPSFFTAVSWAHIVGIRHMISSPGISRKFSIKHLIHCFIIRCRQCPRAMAEPTTRIYCYMLDCFPLSPACRTRTSTSACFRKRKT